MCSSDPLTIINHRVAIEQIMESERARGQTKIRWFHSLQGQNCKQVDMLDLMWLGLVQINWAGTSARVVLVSTEHKQTFSFFQTIKTCVSS